MQNALDCRICGRKFSKRGGIRHLCAESIADFARFDIDAHDMCMSCAMDKVKELSLAREERLGDLKAELGQYQKQILSEKLDAEISDDAVKNYYRTHLDKFVLKTPIVKGLFLKVAETTPELKNLKKWYRGKDHASVENIEKYTLHNIINYDYFYDRWVSFDEVMSAIPYTVTDANRFLQTHTFLEINNEGYWYLLNISDYLPAGAHMPLDFARTQIEEILLNQKRMDFLHQMNKELYQEALENRKIKYYGRVY